MIKIFVDSRETRLLNTFNICIKKDTQFKDIIVETKNLELGDIIINYNDENKVIIERKTVDDLLASIKDHRYAEQSFRLSGSEHPNHNIVYLIESSGDIIRNFNKQMIFSAMFSLNYYKGFSVWRSMDMNETAYMILNCAYKIAKEKKRKPYYDVKTPDDGEVITQSYSSVVKSQKISNITLDNFGEIVLIQIPNISSVYAIAIMEKYKTINNLINAIKEDKDCLNDIKYNTGGKLRRISKTAIKNIVEYLNQ